MRSGKRVAANSPIGEITRSCASRINHSDRDDGLRLILRLVDVILFIDIVSFMSYRLFAPTSSNTQPVEPFTVCFDHKGLDKH